MGVKSEEAHLVSDDVYVKERGKGEDVGNDGGKAGEKM